MVIGVDYGMPLSPLAPSLESLELFVSVVDMGSVSRAAHIHRISQPSASARIQELEKLCKLKLLERTPMGCIATEAGMEIYQLAKETIKSAENLMSKAESLCNQFSSRLKINASYTIAEYLLPEWLAALRKEREALVPDLSVANSHQVIQHVLDGGDLGFIESEDSDDGLEKAEVGKDELWVVVNPKHPWAKLKRPISMDKLASSPIILRERGSGTRSAFQNEMATYGFNELNVVAEIGSTSAIKSSLNLSSSAAVLSKLAVLYEVEHGSLIKIDVEGVEFVRSLYAIWSRAKGITYAERELIKVASRSHQNRVSVVRNYRAKR